MNYKVDSQFYFGPERSRFEMLEDGIIGGDSCMPFHGIISRGLLRSFIENGLSYETWCNYASDPEIYGALSENSPTELQMMQNLIRKA